MPGFTLLCVLTLSIGIGVSAAVFSVVNGILLNPLRYPESERLVSLWHTAPGLGYQELPLSDGTFVLYRDRSRAFEAIGAYLEMRVNLTGGETPERLFASAVTPSLFTVLRVSPQLGRTFVEEEQEPGAQSVVLISDRLWRSHFGADVQLLGKKLRIDGVESIVVGVMPPEFEFPRREIALWRPLRIDRASASVGNFGIVGLGRLKPEFSLSDAESDLNRLLEDLEQVFPASEAATALAKAGFAARLSPFRDHVIGNVENILWLLLGAVGFILLIACANVANLLIVRGEERRREVVICTALGAPRGHLLGIALAESLFLGLAAGAVGLVLAFASVQFLLYLHPANLPRLEEVEISGRVLGFTATLAVLTSLVFGLFPALRSTRITELGVEIRGEGRALTVGRHRRRARQVLVGLQIALALVLLTGAGLIVRSFLRLSSVHPGFEGAKVLTFQLFLPESEYPDDLALSRLFQEGVERLGGVSGVESVGAVSTLPLSGESLAIGHEIEDVPNEAGSPAPVIEYARVAGDYFKTMGIPLLAGRALERRDQEQPTGAVLVSDAFAQRYWPGDSALGKRLRPEGPASDSWHTVVGIVGDVRTRSLTEEPLEIVYYPMIGANLGAWTNRYMGVVVRAHVEPEAMVAAVRSAIWTIDPNLPIADIGTVEGLVRRARASLTFSLLMFLLAAMVALTLGAVGLYGFVSYAVTQRTAEIGVRMAIGAEAADVRWMVLREALGTALIGMLVGILGSAALTRWLQSLLFEISPLDPVTFAVVPLLLVLLVLFASYLPAERAARVDPLQALQRFE